jgi:anti-sigma regulatory factor (Ser/Thr protein kinase)/predicted N-acetyltransferase YhbS
MPAPASCYACWIDDWADMTSQIEKPSLACNWSKLTVPATPGALPLIQSLLLAQASVNGFEQATQMRMQAACEEALSTILRLSHDSADDASHQLEIHLSVNGPALVLRLSDHGLPYDISMLPSYCPHQPEQAHEDAAGLSAFLMQKLADRCQILNHGMQGHHVELQWLLPEAVMPQTAAVPAQADTAATSPAAATVTRPLQPADAIHLARLVYRSYGYSYVNPDMYIAERIQARVDDGRLTSWVAVAQDDTADVPVGHIAFMKSHRDDDTLEVGSAVVAPDQRGGGLLGQLLSTATEALKSRPERAAFVHAVTAHPFTQKTFGRLGYLPTALLLAYTPISLQFRSISGRPSGQRGSVYYACKLLQPAQPVKVYLPLALQPLVLPRADEIGLPLLPQPLRDAALNGITEMPVQVEDALNAAFLTVRHAGEDFAHALRKSLRQLCRQQVDAMYLSLDMADPSTPVAAEAAMAMGFIAAGLTPFMPWPATLCLQYLNNQWLQPEAVCAVGPAAESLSQQVFAQYCEQELL